MAGKEGEKDHSVAYEEYLRDLAAGIGRTYSDWESGEPDTPPNIQEAIEFAKGLKRLVKQMMAGRTGRN